MSYFLPASSTADSLSFWEKTGEVSSLSHTNRGLSGPLSTSPANNDIISPVAMPFIASSLAAGLPLASLGFNDPDVAKRVGVGFYEFNVRNGIRDSAAKEKRLRNAAWKTILQKEKELIKKRNARRGKEDYVEAEAEKEEEEEGITGLEDFGFTVASAIKKKGNNDGEEGEKYIGDVPRGRLLI